MNSLQLKTKTSAIAALIVEHRAIGEVVAMGITVTPDCGVAAFLPNMTLEFRTGGDTGVARDVIDPWLAFPTGYPPVWCYCRSINSVQQTDEAAVSNGFEVAGRR